jgi:hypothetical protein
MRDISDHARLRQAQRQVPPHHIDLALAWGHCLRQGAGRCAWHLGFRESAAARRAGIHIPEHAVGVAVVIARDGTIVTVFRSTDRHRLAATGRRPRRSGGRTW